MLYVTVDMGDVYWVTGVTIWHYYSDARRYCNQKVVLSTTGAFSGEEVTMYAVAGYGTAESADGNTIIFDAATEARYVRHYCSRSNKNGGVHFLEMSICGF